jgi:thiazole/oxazole-forming peptide maturase SagD family component
LARTVADVGGLRCRPTPDAAVLEGALVDHRFGPVRRVYRDAFAPGALDGVEVAVPGVGRRLWGYGRSSNHETARVVGLLEAVERESGCSPQRHDKIKIASYVDLCDQVGSENVMDPASLGLPNPSFDYHPASIVEPYGGDVATAWLQGWAPLTGRHLWVPEHLAYYGAPPRAGAARYLYECSNGTALGGNREEAAVHGAFELIERDAFQLHWYSQQALPPIDLDSITDHESLLYLERAQSEGYVVHLFDATSDVGVPVVQALVVKPQNPDGASFSAAGAHLDPQRAARAALLEVVVMILMQARGAPVSREERLAMLEDPTRVRDMNDHVALYTLPESLYRFDHLLCSGLLPVPLMSMESNRVALDPKCPDIADLAHGLFRAMGEVGMEAVVVDLSSPRDEHLGLGVVKVLAAGAIPLTFGHVHHRTRGLPRLDAARSRTGAFGEPVPHPFP